MNNNDIFRRLRYTFNLSEDKILDIFQLAEYEADRMDITNWLKKEEAPNAKKLHDKHLAIFLNGFINENRGKREGKQPTPEKTLDNNLIFRKLKIALALKDEDIIQILKLADFKVSKHEISALFRKPHQRQYRACKDQFLRNFLMGLQLKHRPKN